jgi:pimeloyl-ACP methyl ester carboxylesterase
MADDTVGLLDALGIDAAHLVGASMGGMISQVLALRYPARVRSLTLLITSPGPDERLSPSSDEVLAIAVQPADTDEALTERGVDLFRVLTGSRYPFDEARYRELAALDNARGTNPNSGHAMAVFTATSRVDELAAVAVPALIVHGTEDPIFPYDHAEVLARAIPDSTLVTWEGVGHEIPEPLAAELQALLLEHIAAAS